VIDGKTCLRVCFMNFRTDADHVVQLLNVVEEVAETL
jgi:hypothetical protein